MGACGAGEPPTISNLVSEVNQVARDEVARIDGTLDFVDDDGDVMAISIEPEMTAIYEHEIWLTDDGENDSNLLAYRFGVSEFYDVLEADSPTMSGVEQ